MARSSVAGVTPWHIAWQQALYGSHGFYRQSPGPVGHFSTSTHGLLGSVLAQAVLELARREGAQQIVDVGCGRGELLTHLRCQDPDVMLTGVDVVPRPDGLSPDIAWLPAAGGALVPEELGDLDSALVIANEWLDVVPCPIAVVRDGGLHELMVHADTGEEGAGEPVWGADLQWCQRFWPTDHAEDGVRVEIGRARDEAWAGLLAHVRSGTAVAIDYGHSVAERPADGTLTGYRRGSLVAPVPNGTCDLTAHVAVDSLHQDNRLAQREALQCLGVQATPVDHALARTDPTAYLAGLSRQTAEVTLLRPGGLGDFWWVVSRVG